MLKYFIRFYLFWTALTILVCNIPIPGGLSRQFSSLLSVIFVGGYLLVAASFARPIITATLLCKRREIAGYLVIVGIIMIVMIIFSRFIGDSGIVGSALSTANLLFGATVVGSVLSTAISRIGELVPVSITAAVADAISVTRGPTKAFVTDLTTYYEGGREGAAPLVDFILIKGGIPGSDTLIPLFGVTDWIFIVLLSSALIRLGKTDNLLSANRSIGKYFFVPVSVLALYAGFLFAQFKGAFIPAMVFIASFFLVFLVLQYEVHKKLRRKDIYYSCLFPFAVTVILLVYSEKSNLKEMFF